MASPIRTAARILWELRRDHGDDAFKYALREMIAAGEPVARLVGDWRMRARDAQLRPAGCAPVWVLIWGRGSGKTRSAAEDTLDHMEDWGAEFSGALCGKVKGDVHKTMVGDATAGLQACAKRRGYQLERTMNGTALRHANGALLYLLSAEMPNMGAGLNLNYFWCDEIALWGHDALRTYKIFKFAVRLRSPAPDGKARGIVTTTPRANEITRYLLDTKRAAAVTVTHQNSYDNKAVDQTELIDEFEGTRLGRQELYAELLDSACLLTPEDIGKFRVISTPELSDVVVALDPGIDGKETSDDSGICAMGATGGDRPECYVLETFTRPGAPWAGWAEATVRCAVRHKASRIVAEINQGANGIVEALQAAMHAVSEDLGFRVEFPIASVWAKASKRARAEPCAAAVEKGRVHFVGHHKQLEKELTTWVEGMDSPNVMDAWTMATAALIFGDTGGKRNISHILPGML